MTRERRSQTSRTEIRSSGDTLTARGYAYRFNEVSSNLGGFVERILPGAGRASLSANDVLATFNHNVDNVLGRRSSGTLRVGEDDHGGWYEIDLPDTTTGRDLAELLRRGDIKGSSFTFRVNQGGQRRAGADDPASGLPVREITSMDVLEVGPVLSPAYPTTDAALRSIAACLGVDLRAADEPKPKDEGEQPEDGPDEQSADEPDDKTTDDGDGEDEPDDKKNGRALVRALLMGGNH
ncbi:HK97 family phage prohead protease [Streptomyces sp. NPDC001404]|uniref:HK97 family phage prohead protease n=1 Tax=Streptomyces sp. NPDC001404 TaxID=3364571 RepID=UPI0036BA597D